MKVDREVLREEGQAEEQKGRGETHGWGSGPGVAGGAGGADEGEGTRGRPGSRVPSGFRRCRPVSLFSWLLTELFGSHDS